MPSLSAKRATAFAAPPARAPIAPDAGWELDSRQPRFSWPILRVCKPQTTVCCLLTRGIGKSQAIIPAMRCCAAISDYSLATTTKALKSARPCGR